MAYDSIPVEVGDINLDNYYLDNQYYNTFTYVHKKFLPKSKNEQKTFQDTSVNVNSIKQVQEKGQQYNIDHICHSSGEKKKMRRCLQDDSIVEQTVKFAKELTPIIVPPSREYSPTPVLYTIKTTKKSGKKLPKFSSSHEYEPKDDKQKSKLAAKKNDKVDTESSREVASQSSQDTLDELNTNNSSSFSLSEVVENNIIKNQRKRKQDLKLKPIVSDYLEAVAGGNDGPNQSEIKIHIMNEIEKNNFYESVRVPIINSVKEYLDGVKNQTDISADLQNLSKLLTVYTQKMDYIMQTLDKIEKKVADYGDKATKIIMSPKPISSKGSRLEELAEDLPEIKEVNSTDEEEFGTNVRNTKASRSVNGTRNSIQDSNKSKRITYGRDHGEDVPVHMNATCSQVGAKQDHSNRIPPRFCWTDATRDF